MSGTLYETLHGEAGKSTGKGSTAMSGLLLVRPFDIKVKGARHQVLMVRIDASGQRLYAIPGSGENDLQDHTEALRWVGERWVE